MTKVMARGQIGFLISRNVCIRLRDMQMMGKSRRNPFGAGITADPARNSINQLQCGLDERCRAGGGVRPEGSE